MLELWLELPKHRDMGFYFGKMEIKIIGKKESTEKLLDLLIKKGLINNNDAKEIKSDYKAK